MDQNDFKAIKSVLEKNPDVLFAYLYGSARNAEAYNDIDIAIYASQDSNQLGLSADIKIALSEKTGVSPDRFDIRVINHLLNKGDLFSLLYLKDVLSEGVVLADNDFSQRAEFIEAFGMKYRECEGLIAEVLA